MDSIGKGGAFVFPPCLLVGFIRAPVFDVAAAISLPWLHQFDTGFKVYGGKGQSSYKLAFPFSIA